MRSFTEAELPGLPEIEAAAARLGADVHRTPLLTSASLGERASCRLTLKCENLQRTGSFKIRGALNACRLAVEEGTVGPAGFVTYSSGNHGQAVALAARLLGFPATVVVPEDISPVKRSAIEGYGARVVPRGLTSHDRYLEAMRLAEERGAHVVAPFDHPHILAGQGTVALEAFAAIGDVELVLVPVGGGGLIGGIACATAALRPEVRVVGVEPRSADALARSLESGKVVTLEDPPRTIADGLRPLAPGVLPFLAARAFVERVVRVTDDAIREAQRLLLERAKLFVEPSGAASVAALLEHPDLFQSRSVLAVLSGGNAQIPAIS